MQKIKLLLKPAFTLIELLIVVAILSILAAISSTLFTGITETKEAVAKQNLKSIFLIEADYHSEYNLYLTTGVGNTKDINKNLFEGVNTLDEKSDYKYSIIKNGIGYKAYAKPKKSDLKEYCVDHNNVLSTSC